MAGTPWKSCSTIRIGGWTRTRHVRAKNATRPGPRRWTHSSAHCACVATITPTAKAVAARARAATSLECGNLGPAFRKRRQAAAIQNRHIRSVRLGWQGAQRTVCPAVLAHPMRATYAADFAHLSGFFKPGHSCLAGRRGAGKNCHLGLPALAKSLYCRASPPAGMLAARQKKALEP